MRMPCISVLRITDLYSYFITNEMKMMPRTPFITIKKHRVINGHLSCRLCWPQTHMYVVQTSRLGAPDTNRIRIIRKYKTILRKYFAKSIFKIVFYFVFSKCFFRSILFCIFKILFESIFPITAHLSL